MAKADPSKVNPVIVSHVLRTGKDRQALYSEVILYSFRTTGNLDCGFDNRDLQAFIDLHHADLFDEKGKRKP